MKRALALIGATLAAAAAIVALLLALDLRRFEHRIGADDAALAASAALKKKARKTTRAGPLSVRRR